MRNTNLSLVSLSAVVLQLAPAMMPSSACAQSATRTASPLAAVEELLAADRSYSAAASRSDVVQALLPMFADDIVMPLPNRTFAEGRAAVEQALRGNPNNVKSRAEWTPIRGGISADGTHGFTFGYMTIRRDTLVSRAKYMAYWIKGAQGWKVAVYKRAGVPEGAISLEMMPPALPTALVPAISDRAVIDGHARGVAAAEQAFSDEAQVIGIGPAFTKYGRADAVNMGPGPGYVVGAEAIGAGIGGPGAPAGSPVVWKSDKVLVASSGDLGISIGMIRPKDDPSAGSPFFTIWKRESPTAPWRYIAE